MRRTLLAAALAACCFPVVAQAAVREPVAASSNAAATALHRLFDSEWERGMRESPENAAARGDHRFDDRWSDMSLAAIERREAADREALVRLKRIDRAALSPADQLNYDTFAPGCRSARLPGRSSASTCSRSATRVVSRPPTASPSCCRSPARRITATGSRAWTRCRPCCSRPPR